MAAPITIDNTPYYIGVMLRRDMQNQHLYLHNVVIEKEISTNSQADLLTTGALENDKHLFITTILQKALVVKNKYMQKCEKDTTKFSFAGGNALTIYINMISMQNMRPCHRESLQKQKRNSMNRWILKQELVQTRGNMLSYEDSISLAREIKRAFQSS